MIPTPAPTPRADSKALWRKVTPEVCAGLLALCLGLGLYPAFLDIAPGETLDALILIEFTLILAVVMMVEIGTRTRLPPGLYVVLCVIGFGLFDGHELLLEVWRLGWWLFLPLLWSLLERGYEAWTLRRVGNLEKYRRRALAYGRIVTGGVTFALFAVIQITWPSAFVDASRISQLGYVLMAAYFALCAVDAWRVHQPAFAREPRTLWHRTPFEGEITLLSSL